MKRPVKYTLISIASVLFLTVGLLIWKMMTPSIDESDGPTSRDKALEHCNLPLPTSAHNIQYASYAAGLQEGYFYVRCDAPVADCYNLANAIFAGHSKDSPHYITPEFQPVSHPEREKNSKLRIDWFDIDQISKGVVAGNGWGWEPKIWIDEERGVFYYEVSD